MTDVNRVRGLLRKLRDPQNGSSWNQKQSFQSIVPYTIEEAYEVADAIEEGNWSSLSGELGDLLYHVLYFCELGEAKEYFTFESVLVELENKVITRNPDIFKSTSSKTKSIDSSRSWEEGKAIDRRKAGMTSELDDIPKGLPATSVSKKIQSRVAGVGFDWPDIHGVLEKVEEELEELKVELHNNHSEAHLAEELGDLMFTLINFSRHASIDPESALRMANKKFERRFRALEEKIAASGLTFRSISNQKLNRLWEEVKNESKS